MDGAYDGNSHTFYKIVAMDLKTKLCLHTEVVHSSEKGIFARICHDFTSQTILQGVYATTWRKKHFDVFYSGSLV